RTLNSPSQSRQERIAENPLFTFECDQDGLKDICRCHRPRAERCSLRPRPTSRWVFCRPSFGMRRSWVHHLQFKILGSFLRSTQLPGVFNAAAATVLIPFWHANTATPCVKTR